MECPGSQHKPALHQGFILSYYAAAVYPESSLIPDKCCAVCIADCVWQDAVANVHLHIYSYEDAYSCGPDMAFARTLITLGMSDRVRLLSPDW